MARSSRNRGRARTIAERRRPRTRRRLAPRTFARRRSREQKFRASRCRNRSCRSLDRPKIYGIRACSALTSPSSARVGTFAVEAAGRPAEAELALRLPHDDVQSRALASWWASILGGEDGLLASALGSAGLARSWDARLLGPERDSAFVVRIASSDAALDNAIAQARALFDRARNGALSADDLARAAKRRARDDLSSSLDPRARLVATWRASNAKSSPPSLDALKNFAASFFHDDAWVIVAARPPRLVEDPSHDNHEKTN